MAAISLLEGIGVLNRLDPKVAQIRPKNRDVKRVSWAPEYNLCQVRLFLAEDAPLQSGLADQDYLQAKQSRLWHAYGSGFEGNQLLGFGNNYTKQNIQEDSIVPETTWCCPPRFVMNPSWQVVAGDESLEVKVQCEREVRNLEAIYPRPSSIPPSPIEPPELQDYNDSDTAMIPLIPIEDDETGDLNEVPPSQDFGELGIGLYEPFRIMHNMKEMQPNSIGTSSQVGNSVSMGPPSVDPQRQASLSISKPATEPDITAAAAAAAAFVAIAKSNEKGNMIDHDMVIKILSNPQIIETLTSQHKRNNSSIQMDLMPNLQAVDSKLDPPKIPCNADQVRSPLIISRLQGACQVASSGVVGNNSSLVTCEMACGNFQGPLHLCNTEDKIFGAAVAVAQTSVSVDFSPPLPPMAGQASSHLSSRPATVVSTTMGACQPSMGASTAATSASVNQSSFPDEQYYKNLIQKHGLQNDNDQIKHQHGFQYYRDLIQQHGGADKFEEQKCQGSHINSGNNDRVAGGNFANNERAFGDPNRSKFRKPCLYFNTPNGCRRGASCAFLHEDYDRPKFDVSDVKLSKKAKAETEAPVRN